MNALQEAQWREKKNERDGKSAQKRKAAMPAEELVLSKRRTATKQKASRDARVFKATGRVVARKVHLDDEKKRQRALMVATRIIGLGTDADIPYALFQQGNGDQAVPEADERVLWRLNAESEDFFLRYYGAPRNAGSQALMVVPDSGLTVFEIKTNHETGEQTIWVLCVFSTYALAERCFGWTPHSVSNALQPRYKGIVYGVGDGHVYFVRKFHDISPLAVE